MSQAVYIVEYRSLAKGIHMLDRMLKRANLNVLHASPICIGKYLICLGGDVSEAYEAQQVVEAEGESPPLSSYLLSNAHPQILQYFAKAHSRQQPLPDAMGVFEVTSAAAGFQSLDLALKSGTVALRRLWLGQLLGGKCCFVLEGSTSDVKNGLKAAATAIKPKEVIESQLILGPDATVAGLL